MIFESGASAVPCEGATIRFEVVPNRQVRIEFTLGNELKTNQSDEQPEWICDWESMERRNDARARVEVLMCAMRAREAMHVQCGHAEGPSK